MYQASWKNYLPHAGAILALLTFVWGAATYSIATLASLASPKTIDFDVLSFEYPGRSTFVNSGDLPLFLSHAEITSETPAADEVIIIAQTLEVGRILSVPIHDGLILSTTDFSDERWVEAKNPDSQFQRRFFSLGHPSLGIQQKRISNLRTVPSSCKVVAFGEGPDDAITKEFGCLGILLKKLQKSTTVGSDRGE